MSVPPAVTAPRPPPRLIHSQPLCHPDQQPPGPWRQNSTTCSGHRPSKTIGALLFSLEANRMEAREAVSQIHQRGIREEGFGWKARREAEPFTRTAGTGDLAAHTGEHLRRNSRTGAGRGRRAIRSRRSPRHHRGILIPRRGKSACPVGCHSEGADHTEAADARVPAGSRGIYSPWQVARASHRCRLAPYRRAKRPRCSFFEDGGMQAMKQAGIGGLPPDTPCRWRAGFLGPCDDWSEGGTVWPGLSE
jgi:hypothetical protein